MVEYHLSAHRLHVNHQVAYYTGCYTKTAYLKVYHDIVEAVRNKCMTTVVLRDLSAAFDGIDHGIIHAHLECSFRMTGNALSGIQSYLNDRTQCVIVGTSTREGNWLTFDELQGSVLEQGKYCLYSLMCGSYPSLCTYDVKRDVDGV